MKLTEQNFQMVVKVGGILLFLSVVGNVYFLLRYREVYRDAGRAEASFQRQAAVLAVQQQTLESLIREFAVRATNDPGIAQIFQRYRPTNATSSAKATQPSAQP